MICNCLKNLPFLEVVATDPVKILLLSCIPQLDKASGGISGKQKT